MIAFPNHLEITLPDGMHLPNGTVIDIDGPGIHRDPSIMTKPRIMTHFGFLVPGRQLSRRWCQSVYLQRVSAKDSVGKMTLIVDEEDLTEVLKLKKTRLW